MAMQKNLVLESGISLLTAYLRITNMVFAYTESNNVNIRLVIYKDQSARQLLKPIAGYFIHNCSGSDFDTYFASDVITDGSTNHVKQGYIWLASLTDYEDAIEV